MATISGHDNGVYVSSGQTLSNETVLNGAYVYVYTSGTSISSVISGSQTSTVSGQAATYDASEYVFSGGLAKATSVGSGGGLVVLASGVASGVAATSDGELEARGGTIVSAVLTGGAFEYVEAGGVSLNASATGSNVSANVTSPSEVIVELSGSAISTMIGSGADFIVEAGGVATSTTISSGGTALVYGLTSGTVLTTGSETIESGGGASGTTIGATGDQIVMSGGATTGTVVSAGIFGENVSGGTATSTTVLNGGYLDVAGLLSGAYTTSGYSGTVLARGIASSTVVSAGGVAYADAGGTTISSILEAGVVDGSGAYETVFGSGLTSGTIVNSGATQEMLGGVASGTAVASGGHIVISSGTETGLTLAVGADVDVRHLTYVSGGTASVDTGDVLTINEGTAQYTIQLAGSYTGEVFQTAADSGGSGTLVTLAVPCFCPGTLIRTISGEVRVETLAVGDHVITVAGRAEPIKWIGRRSYAARFLAGRPHLMPILIRAGALGGALPRRDLRVSPLHAMFLHGVLVPAGQLVNGSTIVQERDCLEVHYLHIELAQHDLIWAEGAPSETFLDDDSRGMFHNAADYAARYPDPPPANRSCYPRVEDGYQLEAIRRRLVAIAEQSVLAA